MGEHRGGSLTDDPEDVTNLSRGTEEENLGYGLCECEALASLRHGCLVSFLLDPEDVMNLSKWGNWNFGKSRAPLTSCQREEGSGDGHHFPWGPRCGAGGSSTGDLSSRLWRRATLSIGARSKS